MARYRGEKHNSGRNSYTPKVKLNCCSRTASPFVKSMCAPCPFLGPGKTAFVSIGNLKVVLDFDEIALVGKVLQAIRTCECDGGVEGGVSSSSDDEKESELEEVSEMKEGVRETGGLTAGGNEGSMVGKAVVLT